MASGAATGCTHTLRPDGHLSSAAVGRFAEGLDDLADRVRGWLVLGRPLPDPFLGDPTDALGDVFAGLAVYSAFQDLPLHEQIHPAVQTRIRRAAEWLDRGGRRIKALVESGAAEIWAGAPVRLVDFQPFLAEADDDLRTLGVGPAGRLRFRGLFTRALRRLDGADPLQAARAELAAAPAVPRLPPDLPPGLEARVTEARLDWIAAGVPAAAFTEPLSMRGATVFLVIGTLVIVLGIVEIGRAHV